MNKARQPIVILRSSYLLKALSVLVLLIYVSDFIRQNLPEKIDMKFLFMIIPLDC